MEKILNTIFALLATMILMGLVESTDHAPGPGATIIGQDVEQGEDLPFMP